MYVKLSATITRSSVWRESPATRCVWIALLALANEHGFVKGVEAWLGSEANVSPDECRAALEKFYAPDLDSQDQDYAGRRVEKVEGGWLVLNYPKYREMRTREQQLAAERQRRKRAKDKDLDPTADGDDGAVSRLSRPVTAIAPATASEVVELPRAREVVEKSPYLDFREMGHDLNWCSECGGERYGDDGKPRLRHRQWCSRRIR